MGRKTPPFGEYPAWTTARFWTFIRSGLRKCWMKWPPKYELLKEKRVKVEGKRHKFEYPCYRCSGWFQQKEITVDHKEPAGQLRGYEDLPGFVKRMFVGKDNLQLLCKPCHKVKTKEERNG